MITITNISKVTDNSGPTPVEVTSNPVQTTVVENPVVKETRYYYDLSPTVCPCRPCCSCCGGIAAAETVRTARIKPEFCGALWGCW